jgi:DtxR family transcriptional regulator, Mn-dependent transcriptional regulator
MSSMRLAFSSDGPRPLTSLAVEERGVVVEVRAHESRRVDRLLALGVTPGAAVTMLQTFPGVVFLCDQTELAVERRVADAIIVLPQEIRP